jgi:hypothetical protein
MTEQPFAYAWRWKGAVGWKLTLTKKDNAHPDIEVKPLFDCAAPADDLRAALEPFAEFARASGLDRMPDDMPMTQGSRMARRQVTAGDFKRALAALSKGGDA